MAPLELVSALFGRRSRAKAGAGSRLARASAVSSARTRALSANPGMRRFSVERRKPSRWSTSALAASGRSAKSNTAPRAHSSAAEPRRTSNDPRIGSVGRSVSIRWVITLTTPPTALLP